MPCTSGRAYVLLIGLVALAVICATAFWGLERKRQADELTRAVELLNGGVGADGPRHLCFVLAGRTPLVSDEQLELLGPFMARCDVESIGLAGATITDASMDTIVRNCPRLRDLDIAGTQVTDVGLVALSGSFRLTSLVISVTTLTPRGIAALSRMVCLRNVRVFGVIDNDPRIYLLQQLRPDIHIAATSREHFSDEP